MLDDAAPEKLVDAVAPESTGNASGRGWGRRTRGPWLVARTPARLHGCHVLCRRAQADWDALCKQVDRHWKDQHPRAAAGEEAQEKEAREEAGRKRGVLAKQ